VGLVIASLYLHWRIIYDRLQDENGQLKGRIKQRNKNGRRELQKEERHELTVYFV
jgi:hypothetical protein